MDNIKDNNSGHQTQQPAVLSEDSKKGLWEVLNHKKVFILLIKKAEKLTAAIYLITSTLSDSEPMKWTLRKKSSEILSFILDYKTHVSRRVDFVHETNRKVLELVSFLEVMVIGELISKMNFSIINQEFLNLSDMLNNLPIEEEKAEKIFPSGLFNLPKNDQLNSIKIDQTIKDKEFIKDKTSVNRLNRHNAILELLRKKGELTIKDIAQVVKNCSEKTLQRELTSFMKDGMVKRIGEKRWSRYLLVQ